MNNLKVTHDLITEKQLNVFQFDMTSQQFSIRKYRGDGKEKERREEGGLKAQEYP